MAKTADFLLTAHRDIEAARLFFEKAMHENDAPVKIAMGNGGANNAAIDEINGGFSVPILVRMVKYQNNIVEQEHRAVKRVTKPMFGFKSYRAEDNVLIYHLRRRMANRLCKG